MGANVEELKLQCMYAGENVKWYHHFGTVSLSFLFINLMQVYNIYCTLPNKYAVKIKFLKTQEPKSKACQMCSCQYASHLGKSMRRSLQGMLKDTVTQ